MMEETRRGSSSCPDIGKMIPWNAFDNWVHAICVVTFDLELGQAMETVLPSPSRLADQERSSVCYLAFPDSNSGCMGDTQFHFRLMRAECDGGLSAAQTRYNSECPPSLQIESAFLYGFAYFRQVKDRSLRRGYFQKSVVLLTRYPFVNLFSKVVGLLAPEYFDGDGDALAAACADIDRWPDPVPGQTLGLLVRGHLFQVRLPAQQDRMLTCAPLPASPARRPAAASTLVASVHEPDLFSALQPLLAHAQLLWELVITAEPLVVMATTPAVCSHVVQALVSLVWPLRYCGDYRPFFTIHDTDFKDLTQLGGSQAPPPVILGVTNPFFAKTLQQWPHILRIGGPAGGRLAGTTQKNKIRKGGSLKTVDSKPGLYTQYKPFLQRDKTIQGKLQRGQATERPQEAQSALLRRYLLELTQSFVLPLERYIATLMPLQRSISPYKAAPVMRPFNPDDFCQRLGDSGPQLTTGIKGDWVGLYRRFFRSTNFSHWFNERHDDISRKLQALHLEALSDADVLTWVKDKQEVEVVDLVLRLRRKLADADTDRLPVHASTLAKLRLQLRDVTRSLPEDVRAVLKQPS
ncbi:protein DENND6B-like [Pollicipes pollicipes]|uniref:protein DENND6B-like n=1 Tax=Pollicipes pollicipes TaxID=41117 RepID=UPI0018852063|nr:protein DENND6B-like [Pollicipes pollicipes]